MGKKKKKTSTSSVRLGGAQHSNFSCDTLDLLGCRKDEAVDMTKNLLSWARCCCLDHVNIITGRGVHSLNQPRIEALLDSLGR